MHGCANQVLAGRGVFREVDGSRNYSRAARCPGAGSGPRFRPQLHGID